MWIEVLPNDIKLLKKFCDVQNNLSCGVSGKPLEPNRLKNQLEVKIDCHAYYYDGKDFKCIIQYKWNRYYKKVQIIKFSITWDFNNKKINIFDAIRILQKHEYQYLKKRNQKELYLYTTPDFFPEAQMLWYIKDKIIEIGLEEGIKNRVERKGNEDHWFAELI